RAATDAHACPQPHPRQAGACVPTTPLFRSALDQCHEPGVCDPASGTCSNPAKANGSICNDGDACSQTDTCQAGVCTGTNPVVCTALDQCHEAGVRDPAGGPRSNPAKPHGRP